MSSVEPVSKFFSICIISRWNDGMHYWLKRVLPHKFWHPWGRSPGSCSGCRMGQSPTNASMFSLPPSQLLSIHPAHFTRCYCRMGQPKTIASMSAPPPSELWSALPDHYTKCYSIGWVNLRPVLPCSLCLRRSCRPYTLFIIQNVTVVWVNLITTLPCLLPLRQSCELPSKHPNHHSKCYCSMGQPHNNPSMSAPPASELWAAVQAP